MAESPAEPPLPGEHRECLGCGLIQEIPPLERGMSAACVRCPTVLHRTATHSLDQSIALNLASLVLLLIMCTTALLSVETAGISHKAGLLSGPVELVNRGMTPLAVVVVFVTLAAPLGKFCGTLYVLFRLREAAPPAHLRRIFRLTELLRTWSMIEVFVFGVFVAYTKLGDLVHIGIDPGLYALLALTFVMIWADAGLDHQEIWDRLDQRAASNEAAWSREAAPTGAVGCEVCGLLSVPDPNNPRCPRCEARLHARKPDSLTRTWALVIAAAVLYIPANYFPVLTVIQLGAGQPSTILGGVQELIQSGLYPLAALVFVASIAIPMLKLVGLSILLIATQTGRLGWLRDRTRIYYIVRWIGRWSMIDIFMESLLGALVRFGSIVTIQPGVGAVAFCAVVILTIFAAETFDPRLMWDAAEQHPEFAAELGLDDGEEGAGLARS